MHPMERSFNMHLDEYYKTNEWSKVQITGFDDDLANEAEKLSTEWVSLYRYSCDDEDVRNASKIIKSSKMDAKQIHQHGLRHEDTNKPEIIADKKNIIFLDKKFFEFEKKSKPVEIQKEPTATHTTLDAADFKTFSTIFGSSSSDLSCDDADVGTSTKSKHSNNKPEATLKNESKNPPKTKTKNKPPEKMPSKGKKNKTRRPKPINLSEFNSTTSTDTSTHMLGAPPGVKGTGSISRHSNIDLSKNANFSLQFRL